MTEKRFKLEVKCGMYYTIFDNQSTDEEDKLYGLDYEQICDLLNNFAEENEHLKQELKKYIDAFDCSQCRFQNYNWFDDGDEFEVCEKGNNEAQMENHSCSEWEEIQ